MLNKRFRAAKLAAVFLLAALATATAEEQTYQDNLVIVLDASGSMGDSMGGVQKMQAAKDGLKTVLGTVPQTTNVGLLVFPHGDWVYPLQPRDDAKLLPAIDSIASGGNTPLGQYMKIGADRLLEQRAKQFGYGSYRLLVITDGEETANRKYADIYAPDIMARGITLDVVGVAMDQQHTLATKVHSYRSADNPASLTRAIREVAAEVSTKTTIDVAGEDAFSAIAGLPDEAASQIIAALVSSGNHPIGEHAQPPSPGAVAGSSAGSTAAGPTNTGWSTGAKILIVFAGVVGLILLIVFLGSRHDY